MPWLKRTPWRALIVVGALAALGAPFVLRRKAVTYTDGAQLNEPASRAARSVRKVLWEPPAPLGAEVNHPELDDYEPCADPYGELLVFTRGRPGEDANLWIAVRERGRWARSRALAELNTGEDELGASFSPDGSWLYFYSNREGGYGGYDIWASRRAGDSSWGPALNLGSAVNTAWNEMGPAPGPRGRKLYFASDRRPSEKARSPWSSTIRARLRAADYDIYVAPRREGEDVEGGGGKARELPPELHYGAPAPVEGLNRAGWAEGAVVLSPAGDFLYFASNRPGDGGGFDLYRSRLTDGVPGPPESLGPLINSARDELDPALASGGFELYFARARSGQEDLFLSLSREVFVREESGGPYWSLSALLEFLADLLRRIPPELLVLLLFLLVCVLLYLLSRRFRLTVNLLTRCFLLALLLHLLLALWMHRHSVQRMILEAIEAPEKYEPFEVSLESLPEEIVGAAIRESLAETDGDAFPALIAQPAARRPIRARLEIPSVLETPVGREDGDLVLPLDDRAPARPEPSSLLARDELPAAAVPERVDVSPLPALDARSPELPRAEEKEEEESDRSALSASRRDRIPAPAEPLARHIALEDVRPAPGDGPNADAAAPVPELADLGDVRLEVELPDPTLPRPVESPTSAPVEVAARRGVGAAEEGGTAPPRLDPLPGPAAVHRPFRDSTPEERLSPGSERRSLVAFQRALPSLERQEKEEPGPPQTFAPGAVRLPAGDPETPGLPPVFVDSRQAPEIGGRKGSRRMTSPPAAAASGRPPALPLSRRKSPQPRRPASLASSDAAGALGLARTTARAVALEPPRAAEPVSRGELLTKLRPVVLGESAELDITPSTPGGARDRSSGFVPRIYSLRGKTLREEVLRARGGSEETERAVEAGLTWLAVHQSPDGRWSLEDYAAHLERPSRRDLYHPDWNGRGNYRSRGGSGKARRGDTAATGLALLCFLGHGDTHLEDGAYRESVERGLAWLLRAQRSNGDLRGGGNLYMHAIASFALCEAYAFTRDPALREPAQRAIDYTRKSQNPHSGGWRYDPYPAGRDADTSVFGWMLMALKSGRLGGLEVDERCLRLAARYLDAAHMRRDPGRYLYQPGSSRTSLAMSAQGAFSLQMLSDSLLTKEERENPALRRVTEGSVKYMLSHLPRAADMDGVNFYYWYYATLALSQEGGEAWKIWNDKLSALLVDHQVGREHGTASGSWDPRGRRALTGGRLYSTALSVLCLEAYYRYAPLR